MPVESPTPKTWTLWVGALLLLLLPSLFWILADRSVWTAAAAESGRHTLSLWSSLTGSNHEPWHWLMLYTPTQQPTGLCWFTQPLAGLGALTGNVSSSLLLGSVLLNGLSLWLIGRTVRELYPKSWWPTVAAVLFVAGAPAFVETSHRYTSEPLQLLCIAGFYRLALRCQLMQPLVALLWLVLLSCLGVMASMTTPVYVLLPGLYIVGVLFDAVRRHRRLLDHWSRPVMFLALAAVLAFLGASMWYAVNAERVLGFAAHLSHAGLIQGPNLPRPMGDRLGTALTALLHASFLPWFFLLVLLAWCIGSALMWALPPRRRDPRPLRGVILGTALVQLAGCVLLFSRYNEDLHRLFHGLLPALALVLAWFVHTGRASPAPRIVAGTLLLHWLLVHAQSLALPLPAALTSRTVLTAITTDASRLNELKQAQRLMQREHTPQQGARLVGADLAWLNASSMNYLSALRLFEEDALFTLYAGIEQGSPTLAQSREALHRLAPRYVVTADPSPGQRGTSAFLRALESRTDARRIPFPSTHGLRLYQLTAPLP